jgi:hypothetical protein
MKVSIDDRRAQLLACAQAIAPLATNREIKAVHVSKVEADHEIRRVLETIVRRWTKGVTASYTSKAGSADPAADLDHVVPCRVIVDRMIMNPIDVEALLQESIVLARITKAEHQQLGGIFQHHAEVYERLLSAPVDQLHEVALERYKRSKVKISRVKGA